MSTTQQKLPVFKICTAFGTGSGFLVEGFPYIVTNYHVIAGVTKVAIECQDRSRRTGDVVFIDPASDIALVMPAELPPGSAESALKMATLLPQVGDSSFIHGFPFGMPYSVSQGVVSAIEQPMGDRKYIQTDAAVNPGNSGGPMIDGAGHVVGITSCKVRDAENIGFGIPMEHLQADLELCQKEGNGEYALKCPSCESLITVPDEFCDSCGVELDQDQFFPDGALSALAEIVEGALAVDGADPVLARRGYHNWELIVGSAVIECLMVTNELFCVRTSMAMLPTKPSDVLRFVMAYDDPDYTFVVGTSGRIWLRSEMHLSDVFHPKRRATIQRKISRLGKVADEMDNYLIDTFGCEPSPETYVASL
ncbi:Putative serine protease HtrA [Planctomycetes bacterium Poly30]|uniref:Serine protease HtrA n=1 Tax=Saltatorellus ferox TaxID=2528018 RepID=A0A518EL24_9BACT|nr:Putative serine protease HtrA [Planctomycetes bacterium Poly30]